MKQTRTMEMGTGLFALLGIGALFFLTTQTTGNNDFDAAETFAVEAYFDNVGSLKKRAPVSMSGVTIGRVTNIHFDAYSLEAVVTFVIDSQYDQIPANLQATGENHVQRGAGHDAELARHRHGARQRPVRDAGPHAALDDRRKWTQVHSRYPITRRPVSRLLPWG